MDVLDASENCLIDRLKEWIREKDWECLNIA